MSVTKLFFKRSVNVLASLLLFLLASYMESITRFIFFLRSMNLYTCFFFFFQTTCMNSMSRFLFIRSMNDFACLFFFVNCIYEVDDYIFFLRSKKVMVIQFISLKIGDFNLAKSLIISNSS